MRYLLTSTFVLFYTISFSQNLSLTWAKVLEGNKSAIESIVVDGNGFVYLTGIYTDTTDFDLGLGVHNKIAGCKESSLFIMKMDSNANFIWVKTIDSARGNCTLTPNGSLLLHGVFRGTADFDPNLGVHNMIASNGCYFLCELDTAGNFQWVKQYGPLNSSVQFFQQHLELKFDNAGDLVIVGTYSGNFDADPDGTTVILNSSGTYILKLTATGSFVWVKEILIINTYVTGEELGFDSLNNVYIVGHFWRGTIDFDPGPAVQNRTGNSSFNMFLLKLDQNGIFQWAHTFDVNAHDNFPRRLEVDKNDNVIVTGVFSDTVDFDPSPSINSLISYGNNDLFIAKYSSIGTLVWVKHIEGTVYNSQQNEVINTYLDDNNDFIITGGLGGSSFDFDPGAGVSTIGDSTSWTAFIAKYDSNGNMILAAGFPSNLWALGSSIVPVGNNFYLGGVFFDTLDADPTTNVTAITNDSTFFTGFVLKLSIQNAVGINNHTTEISVKVYPNPTTNTLFIKSEYDIRKVFVYDMSGRQIPCTMKNNVVDTTPLLPGLYALMVETKSGTGAVQFIKK